MKFSLLVTGSPTATQAPFTALRFAQAAVAQGHEIVRVFFYHDAVLCASAPAATHSDTAAAQWHQFLQQQHAQGCTIDAVVCVTAASKRGINDSNVLGSMQISGLGQLIDGCVTADRTLTFGG